MRLGATADMRYIMVSGGKVYLYNLPFNQIHVVTTGKTPVLWMHGKVYEIHEPKEVKS